jgi:prepilin-type N-terminal cleavage/methylation domain-containing protein
MSKMRTNRNKQSGFTLVEIAIVMVIIGLLIAGILKGQAMIQHAKVKRVVTQADEIRAAVNTFFDQYGQYPGDENLANIPPGDVWNGNGDGQIANNQERYDLFLDLQLAGLISGNYNGTTDLPKNPFGGTASIYWVTPPGPGTAKQYIVFTNLPAEVCQEIDVKNDDGVDTSGSIRASAAYTPGNTIANFYMLF